MYNPKEVFEKLKCRECRNLVGCGYTNRIKCYNKYLEEQNKLMLEFLEEVHLCEISPVRTIDIKELKKLIEKVTQKKIEELKEYDDVCIDDLIGGNG